MNQKLLIVLAVSANDGPLAERLLDFIHKLNGKKQVGHLLIVANSDLHAELRTRIRITAELAFESVTETIAPAVAKENAHHKVRQMNNLFRHAAQTVQTHFRWPWFWLEPDCVPVKTDWLERLASAYESQPKKYVGLVSGEKPFMARCGVYYPAASYEVDKLCLTDVPFPVATADKVVPSATRSDLIQYLKIESVEDLAKISEKAVVVHGDKAGVFAENWEAPQSSCRNESGLKTIVVNDGGPLPRQALVELTDETAALLTGAMQPQEIAKEIKEFLVRTEGTAVPITAGEIADSTGKVINAPRLSRRQKRELVNNGAKV